MSTVHFILSDWRIILFVGLVVVSFAWNAINRVWLEVVWNASGNRNTPIPEKRWTYNAHDLDTFARVADSLGMLGFYVNVVLWRSDICFAIALAAITAFTWYQIAVTLMDYWFNWAALLLGGIAILYGIADVAEDMKLARILGHPQSIDADDVAATNVLTRIKMITLTLSVIGILIFLVVSFFEKCAIWLVSWGFLSKKNDLLADVGDVLLDELQFVKLRRALLSKPDLSREELSGYSFVERKREEPADKIEKIIATPLQVASNGLPAGQDVALVEREAGDDNQSKFKRYCREASELGNLSALCLSGGGIRSAAFALGVVQGLACRGVLKQFDYLSTVSGGGYLGGFLTAWVQRKGYKSVCDALSGNEEPSQSPVRHLRRYSSYLTPYRGLITADTLAVVTLYLRNLFLNWLIIIPLLVSVIIFIKMFALLVWGVSPSPLVATSPSIGLVALTGVVAVTLNGVAVLDSIRQRPGWESDLVGSKEFQRWEMWPLLLGGIAASWSTILYLRLHGPTSLIDSALGLGAGYSALHIIAWMIAYFVSRPADEIEISTRLTVRAGGWKPPLWTLTSLALSGFCIGSAFGVAVYWVNEISNADVRWFVLLCFGPPIMLAAFLVGEMLHIGITSYIKWGDGEREWLARAAAYHTRAALTWMSALLVIFGGSYVLFKLYDEAPLQFASLGTLGGITGILTAVVGRASATAAVIRERYHTWKNVFGSIILAIVMPLFVIITLSFLSFAVDALTLGEALTFSSICCGGGEELFLQLLVIFAIAVVIGFIASLIININRFSLHGVYRNRLIRAFLGASRVGDPSRKPNPFTEFDEKDNEDLANLWPNKIQVGYIPPQLHVILALLILFRLANLLGRSVRPFP
jgi:hypothetical protein